MLGAFVKRPSMCASALGAAQESEETCLPRVRHRVRFGKSRQGKALQTAWPAERCDPGDLGPSVACQERTHLASGFPSKSVCPRHFFP